LLTFSNPPRADGPQTSSVARVRAFLRLGFGNGFAQAELDALLQKLIASPQWQDDGMSRGRQFPHAPDVIGDASRPSAD